MNRTTSSLRNRAFTIIELLVVIAIISLLAGGAALALPRMLKGAQNDTAKNDLKIIETAIKAHELSNPNWSSLSELPLEPQSLTDPWGNPYTFTRSGEWNGQRYKYIIFSMGPNGVPNTFEGDDDIIHLISE